MMRKQIRKPIKVNKKCFFCEGKIEPDYYEINILNKFLTERGKIISRARTGLCNIHQRRLENAVKKARFMALLPFVIKA